MNPELRLHAFFSGNVQGVYFRATTNEIASKLPLTGWVRNLDDGRVELLAEGSEHALNELMEGIKTAKLSNIDEIEVIRSAATGDLDPFRIA